MRWARKGENPKPWTDPWNPEEDRCSKDEVLKYNPHKTKSIRRRFQINPHNYPTYPQHYYIHYGCLHLNTSTMGPRGLAPSKWEVISLAFIIGFHRTRRKHDSIIVVVDKLTKSTHFIPVNSTYKYEHVEEVFVKVIFWLHGVPNTIISNKDTKFTSIFLENLICWNRYTTKLRHYIPSKK